MPNESGRIAGLFKTGGLFAFSGIIGKFLSFFGHIAIVRILAPGVFGDISLASAIVGTIAPLVVFGLSDGLPRLIAGADSEKERSALVSSGLATSFFVGLLGAGILIFLSPVLANYFDNSALEVYIPVLSIILLSGPVGSVLVGVFRGYEEPRAIAFSRDILPGVIALAVFPLAIVLIGPDWGAVTYHILLDVSIVLVGLYILFSHSKITIVRPTPSAFGDLISFSWPLAFSSVFVVIMLNADILFLGYLSNSTAVGQYRSVRPLAKIVLIGLTSVVTLYIPVVTKYFESGERSSVRQCYKVVAKWLAIITFPLVGVFSFFAPEVVVGFFGPEYEHASIALAVLSVGMYGRVLSGPNGATTKAIDRPRVEFYAAVVGLVFNIILNAVLIPKFGLMGAAIATSTGFLAYNALEIATIYKDVGALPFSWNMAKPLAPSILLGLGLHYALPSGLSLPVLVCLGIVWTTCQLLFVPATSSFDQMDKDIIMQFDFPFASKFVTMMQRFQRL